jgi:hypothetical protein
VGQQHDACALAREFFDGRHQAVDTGRIGDPAVPHGDVEIGAQQHAPSRHIQVIKGLEACHPSLPIVAE